MLQRIQTVYLLIVAIISGGLIFAFNLWTTAEGTVVYAKDEVLALGLFVGSAILAISCNSGSFMAFNCEISNIDVELTYVML